MPRIVNYTVNELVNPAIVSQNFNYYASNASNAIYSANQTSVIQNSTPKTAKLTPGTWFTIDGRRIRLDQQIGKGVYGTVFRVSLAGFYPHEKLCLKVQQLNSDTAEQINEEMRIMRRIKESPGGCQFLMTDIFSFQLPGYSCFLMQELGCSLLKLLNLKMGPFDMSVVQDIGFQILSGLNHLHYLGLTHCDVKPSNILVNSDQRGLSVKVADFGNTCQTGEMHKYRYRNCVQATWYRPPEVYLGMPQNHKADIWAVGCILAEMYIGEPLFITDDDCYQLAYQHFHLIGIPFNACWEGRYYSKFFTVDEFTGMRRPYTQEELSRQGKRVELPGPTRIYTQIEQLIPYGKNGQMGIFTTADYDLMQIIRSMLHPDVTSRAEAAGVLHTPFFYSQAVQHCSNYYMTPFW